MDKIYFNKENIEALEEFDSGGYAVIRKYGNDALKIYKSSEFINKRITNIQRIASCQKKLERLDVIVPKKEVYVDGKLQGYAMNFINGFSLYDLYDFKQYHVSRFTLSCKVFKLKRNIDRLSALGFCIHDDLYLRNLMWDHDQKRFVLIDIDFWKQTHPRSFQEKLELKRENFSAFNKNIKTDLYEGNQYAQARHLFKSRTTK